MDWIDICGPPGVGKSTLCDGLWPPRCIEWDGLPYPDDWERFLYVVDSLLRRISGHPSFRTCLSMVQRSFRKISTVSRMTNTRVYIQTGLAQRGLGIGWRLDNPDVIDTYYKTMPVSLGVVFLVADVPTIQARNVARGKDRSSMVPKMERPREIAVEVLRSRGVPVLELDTRNSIKASMAELDQFACAVTR